MTTSMFNAKPYQLRYLLQWSSCVWWWSSAMRRRDWNNTILKPAGANQAGFHVPESTSRRKGLSMAVRHNIDA